MNRRNLLAMTLSLIALPLTGMASVTKKTLKLIRVSNFTDQWVELTFPDTETRRAFWVTFTDVMWPKKNREGKNGESFQQYYGPIIDGTHRDWGGLTAKLHRSSYFDQFALKTAAILYQQGIVLEVIKTDKQARAKSEKVVIPKFTTVTETRAEI